VSFDVPAGDYYQFMGRYSEPLAVQFADWLPLAPGQRVLDVGCGPGALTAVLAARLSAGTAGGGHVSAIDPSDSFAAATRARVPGADVRRGAAEALPWPDDSFDGAAAQLVVHLMADPPAGLAEMARVTRPGGLVAATVWDFVGDGAPASTFWHAALAVDPAAPFEAGQPGAAEGDLARLLRQAGLAEVESSVLVADARIASFEEWWHPFTLGVGPPGAYLATLGDDQRAAVRKACQRLHPEAPFTLPLRSWAARGRA
jgi:SAM-dependent methyltransferase